MPSSDPMRTIGLLTLLAAAIFALFAVVPGLDLAVTRAFHGADGFWGATWRYGKALRGSILLASQVLVVIALVAFVIGWWREIEVFGVANRVWLYILTLYVLGPGLLVDRGLQRFWGRARPEQLIEFGGRRSFTPVHVVGGECRKNCSFVSGDVAGATALAAALIVLSTQPGVPPGLRWIILVIAPMLPAVAAFQRVSAGRHFLSDVLLAILLIAILAVALGALLLRQSIR